MLTITIQGEIVIVMLGLSKARIPMTIDQFNQ